MPHFNVNLGYVEDTRTQIQMCAVVTAVVEVELVRAMLGGLEIRAVRGHLVMGSYGMTHRYATVVESAENSGGANATGIITGNTARTNSSVGAC